MFVAAGFNLVAAMIIYFGSLFSGIAWRKYRNIYPWRRQKYKEYIERDITNLKQKLESKKKLA